MKYRMLALILALTVVTWAQTATQTAPATPEQNSATDKTKCPCCEKMAASDSKDTHAACMRKHHHGKEMASCCGGKDGKCCGAGADKECCCGKDASCMKDGEMADCCKGKEGMKCDRKGSKGCGKGCCGSNKSEKTA